MNAKTNNLAQKSRPSLGARIKTFFGFGGEGSLRGPFQGQGELGGWYPIDPNGDGWQRHLNTGDLSGPNATAFACRSLLASLAASLPYQIKEQLEDGSYRQMLGTDGAKVLAKPNSYQTSYEFFEMLFNSLLTHGNAYCVKVFNERRELEQLLPVSARSVVPHHVYEFEGGPAAIFYAVSSNFFQESIDYLVPASDVLHIRINTDPREPLRGRSPLENAAAAMGLHNIINMGLNAYHYNASRVGALLTSDAALTSEQILQLKSAWAESAQGWKRGKTVVLPGGLKAVNLTDQGASAADQQLLELMHASDKSVARVYRVPPELVGLESANNRSAEEASRWLLSTALGPLLEVVEQSLSAGLKLNAPQQWVEADTRHLLRTDEKARWEAIETSVRSGVKTLNEARKAEGLPPVQGGDTPLVQQQDIPLGMASEFAAANIDRLRREAERNNPDGSSQSAEVKAMLDGLEKKMRELEPVEKELRDELARAEVRDIFSQRARNLSVKV